MSVREYIGARYVPLFADPLDWDSTKTYEPLTIVYYQGNSFTSRQFVPTGIDISNTAFWALTGNYNAQVEAYRAEVATYNTRVEAIENKFDANGKLEDDTVISDSIEDGAVTSDKIADGAVTPDKLSGTISTANITDNAITTAKIADDAVTSDKIADNAVTSDKIADSAITPDKISDDLIRAVYDTASDMVDTTLTSGYVKTLGYRVSGIGGCIYEISSTDNELNSIQLANNYYATPIYNPYCVTPEMFGAYGDGTHDDTTYIQLAINSCEVGATVQFFSDAYVTSDTINIDTDRITLQGVGYYYRNEIVTTANPVIKITTSNCSIEHMYFRKEGVSEPKYANGLCIKMDIVNHNDFVCTDSGFLGFSTCIECYGRNVSLKHSYITWCRKAIRVKQNAESNPTLGITVDGCSFHGCTDEGNTSTLDWDTVNAWVIDIDSTVTLYGAAVVNNTFDGISFIGAYRGPGGALIMNNHGVDKLGGCYGHVYLNAPSSGTYTTRYINNDVVCYAAKGVNNVRDWYIDRLIYGYIGFMVMSGNTFTMSTSQGALVENMGGNSGGQNYASFLVSGNTIQNTGTPFTVFKYNPSTASGGNAVYAAGNVFRSGNSETNCYIFGNSGLIRNFADLNYQTGFTLSQ